MTNGKQGKPSPWQPNKTPPAPNLSKFEVLGESKTPGMPGVNRWVAADPGGPTIVVEAAYPATRWRRSDAPPETVVRAALLQQPDVPVRERRAELPETLEFALTSIAKREMVSLRLCTKSALRRN